MFQGLVNFAHQFLQDLNRPGQARTNGSENGAARAPVGYLPLKRVVLTDGVGRTLFEEFGSHQAGARGDEETGWVLLGIRQPEAALVMATLPAGAARDAGVSHVQFNSWGQIMGCRIVRQVDRRLTILGVVHTHPGSLRHPSDGDYRGDAVWVGQLRGGDDVFGIGTADCSPAGGTPVAHQPRPNVQCLGKLRLSWYALRSGDKNYRRLPVGFTLGPDLARPLHSVWSVIESHAIQLDRLCRQQAGVTFEVVAGNQGTALGVRVPLAEPEHAIRILLEGKEVCYHLVRADDTLLVDPHEARIDRAVYLLLAELAAQHNE